MPKEDKDKEIAELKKEIESLRIELDCIPERGELYYQAKENFKNRRYN